MDREVLNYQCKCSRGYVIDNPKTSHHNLRQGSIHASRSKSLTTTNVSESQHRSSISNKNKQAKSATTFSEECNCSSNNTCVTPPRQDGSTEAERLRILEIDLNKIRNQLCNLTKSKTLALSFTAELQTRYKNLLLKNEEQCKEIENLKKQNRKLLDKARSKTEVEGSIISEIEEVDSSLHSCEEKLNSFANNFASAASLKGGCCTCKDPDDDCDTRNDLSEQVGPKSRKLEELERNYEIAKQNERLYQDEINRLSEVVKTLQGKLNEAMADCGKSRSEVSKAKRDSALVNEKCKVYKEQLEEKCREIERLNKQCLEASAKCECFVNKIEEKYVEIEQLKREKDQTQEKCKCAMNELQETSDDLRQLSKKYLEANERCKCYAEELERKCQEINMLREEHESTSEQCSCYKTQISKKCQEVKCLNLQVSQLKAEILKGVKARDDAHAKYEALLNQYRALEARCHLTEENLRIRQEMEVKQPCKYRQGIPCKQSCSGSCSSQSASRGAVQTAGSQIKKSSSRTTRRQTSDVSKPSRSRSSATNVKSRSLSREARKSSRSREATLGTRSSSLTNKKLRSDTNQLRSEANQLRSDTNQLRSDTNQLHSDTNQLRSDTNQLRSDTSQLRSDTSQQRRKSDQMRYDIEKLTEPSEVSVIQKGFSHAGVIICHAPCSREFSNYSSQQFGATSSQLRSPSETCRGPCARLSNDSNQLRGGVSQLRSESKQMRRESSQLKQPSVEVPTRDVCDPGIVTCQGACSRKSDRSNVQRASQGGGKSSCKTACSKELKICTQNYEIIPTPTCNIIKIASSSQRIGLPPSEQGSSIRRPRSESPVPIEPCTERLYSERIQDSTTDRTPSRSSTIRGPSRTSNMRVASAEQTRSRSSNIPQKQGSRSSAIRSSNLDRDKSRTSDLPNTTVASTRSLLGSDVKKPETPERPESRGLSTHQVERPSLEKPETQGTVPEKPDSRTPSIQEIKVEKPEHRSFIVPDSSTEASDNEAELKKPKPKPKKKGFSFCPGSKKTSSEDDLTKPKSKSGDSVEVSKSKSKGSNIEQPVSQTDHIQAASSRTTVPSIEIARTEDYDKAKSNGDQNQLASEPQKSLGQLEASKSRSVQAEIQTKSKGSQSLAKVDPSKSKSIQILEAPSKSRQGKSSASLIDLEECECSDDTDDLEELINEMYQEIDKLLSDGDHDSSKCRKKSCVECCLRARQNELCMVRDELESLKNQFNSTLMAKQALAKSLMRLEESNNKQMQTAAMYSAVSQCLSYDTDYELECYCESVDDD